MAFLRHDLPVSTQEAVLFDSEGGTHVKGRSTRVAQQPGGNSSFSFGWGMDTTPAPVGRVSRKGSAPSVATTTAPLVNKVTNVPPAQQSSFNSGFVGRKSEVSMPAPAPVSEAPSAPANSANSVYNALYCVEGAQVRTRPARKSLAPPGGASSIIF